MKIAQISPLMESVPPRLYGGSERIVSYLTDELVRQGHDVTLFASGDSGFQRESGALRADGVAPRRQRARSHPVLHADARPGARAWRTSSTFSTSTSTSFTSRCSGRSRSRTVTTLHGRQDLHDLKPLYVGFSDMPLVSISNSQRKPIANANFAATVYHGLPAQTLKPNYKPSGDYVAFLGRISPEKRPDRAIRIAQALGLPIKIAAKIDKVDEAYFREQHRSAVQPARSRVSSARSTSARKSEFLGEARALLFPIDWPEPFGLVHDRGDGVRHAGARLPLRLGARDHRSRRDRPDCR